MGRPAPAPARPRFHRARAAARRAGQGAPPRAGQPDGLDPCDLRLAQGEGAVRELIAQRVPLFEFAIRSAVFQHDLESAEGRLAALDEAAPIIRRIKDEGLRQMYAVKLDRWLG